MRFSSLDTLNNGAGRVEGFARIMPQITNILSKENLEELNRNLGTNYERIKERPVKDNKQGADR